MNLSVISTGLFAVIGLLAFACSWPPPHGGRQKFDPLYREQIEAIATWRDEICEMREQIGLPCRPLGTRASQFDTVTTCTRDERPTEGTCGEVCEIAEDICENAEDICRVAGDMPGNAWAAQMCREAKVSCQEAEKKCCSCDESTIGGGTESGTEKLRKRPFWD